MMIRTITLAAISLGAAVAAPADAEIRKILADRVDAQRQAVGIVVGVIDPQGRRIVAFGKPSTGGGRELDGDTVFEIGSITKVFTSLLLAEMAGRGELAVDDPISKYLPEGVKAPTRDGRAITLEDLATHTSGLPRLPSNLNPKDAANPYSDYSDKLLYEFLSTYELKRDIGSQFEYSNLAVGLLGHLLARRGDASYESLLKTRVFAPLDLKSTTIALTPALKSRMATGYNNELKEVSLWDFDVLAGCGAIRSTTNDLLKLLAVAMGYEKSPLKPAVDLTVKPRRQAKGPQTGLGWLITKTPGGKEIVWHNGGTYGYRSFAGYDPASRTGVVVLSNTFTTAGVDDIGMHLLDEKAPLAAPRKQRTEITVAPKILEGYVGKYQLNPQFFLTVTRDGNRLFVEATKQPKFEVFAETQKHFFLKVVEASITFEAGEDGRATHLILHQNGNHRAERVE